MNNTTTTMHRSLIDGKMVYHPYTREDLLERIEGGCSAAHSAALRAAPWCDTAEMRASESASSDAARLQSLLAGWID